MTRITDIDAYVRQLARDARAAACRLATVPAARRNAALQRMADALDASADMLRSENARDVQAAEASGLGAAMIDRLTLNDSRIGGMAASLRQIAAQVEPVGQIVEGCVRPNGLRIERVRVPIGVVGFIYESRPNVTSDAAGLCIKSGNAILLRGGKEAIHSNTAIWRCIREALAAEDLPPAAVQLIETPDRAAVAAMLALDEYIDVVIPRGGEGLIRTVVAQARMPVIKHYTGVCHVYVGAAADLEMAGAIVLNAKCQRPAVCNAMEHLLVHAAVADRFVPGICRALADRGVELRGDEAVCARAQGVRPATEEDWKTEYLDLIVSIKEVATLEEAIAHINRHGSHHTDAIVTRDLVAAERFVREVDSASVMVNASTRFSDGGEYGLGAEIGISTDKLHARGPMGAADLTTTKWIVRGDGHVRE
jgi:glutamate-5-semialdehyde dehydrogenase